jgi:cytochrome c2
LARWIRASARIVPAALLFALAPDALFAGDETASALRFARHGEVVASRNLTALRAAVDAQTLTVFEPYEAREIAFRALPFADVLDRVFTPSWRDEEELLFTCRDGYQPTVPVKRALEHRAWLAFERREADFSIRKLESGRHQHVPLGPFYLIWENLDDPVVRAEGDYGWPYQLVGVELVRARDRFPRMSPPEGAGALVHTGYTAFRMYCSRCHAMNGEGGAIGPELNAAGQEVGGRDPAWLRRWIDDPSRFVPNARMPALDPGLRDRDHTLDALIAYLRAMAHQESPHGG